MEPSTSESCRQIAVSNDYEDFLLEFSSNLDYLIDELKPVCLQTAGPRFGVFYQPRDPENEMKYINRYGYNRMPKLYGLMDTTSIEASGALRVRRQPYLNLYGKDVILGFVDTGIEYRNLIFQNADQTSRILTIWDQADQTGNVPEGNSYGSEYTQAQINEALKSDDPLSIVPSIDTNGHGTFLAGIAAGGVDSNNDFTGVAPGADIVVVKLKEAKPYLKAFYGVQEDVTAFSSADIMMGINYIWQVAKEFVKPVVVCIGLGSSSGDHTGRAILSSFLDEYADLAGNCVVIAAGNEGNQAHHFHGQLENVDEVLPMEIRVGSNEQGFALEIWGQLPYLFSISITSPTGEVIPRVNARIQPSGNYKLAFERTEIDILYTVREPRTGDELVYIRFKTPTEGIWTINIYSDTKGKQRIDAWLPISNFISPDTYFIRPDPSITITQPGNSENPITVATYNHTNGSIFIESSRGLTRNGRQKPIITAPGVDVYGPTGLNTYGIRSGSSVATAHAAGAAAMIFEWGMTQGNDQNLDTITIQQLLISGANRTDGLEYPNNIWGYGILNLYEAFNSLRITSS